MSVTPDYVDQELARPALWKRLSIIDWLWAALFAAGTVYAWSRYGEWMDGFETAILFATLPVLIAIGWLWKPFRGYAVAVAALSLASVGLYGGELARGETGFLLKYLLASQSAIMWMSALFVMATFAYWFGLFIRSDFAARVGSALTWGASGAGAVGMMVRWRESYLISPDVGHIPVANLYEVFILFAVITGLLYLYYEDRYRTRALGAFALTVISAAVGFLLWYAFGRGGSEIQPLVPALQSYWMKIHVPANFVGYGAFALAAMLGVAYLAKDYRGTPEAKWAVAVASGIVALLTVASKLILIHQAAGALDALGVLLAVGYGVAAAAVSAGIMWLLAAERVAAALPPLEQIDDLSYKSIALGFAFFTVATVLGAMWAAEAWGGYWSWDPKETWALIVWLNYAAWLHMRLTKGWRGRTMAWWAVVGLVVTLFAFLGVNMFLSGLHSYGSL